MWRDSLKDCFTKFCQIKNGHNGDNDWFVTSYPFLYPTTLMPLLEYIVSNDLRVRFHPNVAGYVKTILPKNTSNKSISKRTYIQIAMLRPGYVGGTSVLDEVIHLLSKQYGGLDSLYYLLSELTSNIYDHSEFTKAFIMAQEYPKKEFTEICIYDNGISIPQCFQNHGFDSSSDANYIHQAINGKSTKKEDTGRGYGINSSTRMVIDGFDGEMFIASRNGAIQITKEKMLGYKCEGMYELEGTLVSMRLPKRLINYSEHISGKRNFSKFEEEKRCR
ncbi:ATP-binding protein [Methanobacterium alcaliphilum]|uniref:ATP-binding protein n=1 Tax=Methanobacterium alcaliphilum TaxID=392018 RepID=UPI00200B8AB4|nr:ATP-binding protein [Methanobacterium alcaliphilum]MCK9150480.1 ATP-binding protein [Methanobacterium alcaliphilum]